MTVMAALMNLLDLLKYELTVAEAQTGEEDAAQQVVDETGVEDDSRELLSAAHRNAHRLLALVNDLLDLERVGSGRS